MPLGQARRYFLLRLRLLKVRYANGSLLKRPKAETSQATKGRRKSGKVIPYLLFLHFWGTG